MKKKTILLAAGLLLALVAAAVSQTPASPKHQVVFQMSEGPDAWESLIAHVTNSMNALEPDGGMEVEVVFFGPGLRMIVTESTPFADQLKELSERGVTLSACQNAMRFMGVKSEDLLPFTREVDSGIAQLIRRQEAGWSYIH